MRNVARTVKISNRSSYQVTTPVRVTRQLRRAIGGGTTDLMGHGGLSHVEDHPGRLRQISLLKQLVEAISSHQPGVLMQTGLHKW